MQVKEPSSVIIDGRKMAYDEVSPPNPKGTILLLTGLSSKRLAWYKQLEVFGRAFRTIALDNRDIGDSDPVTDPYTIADLADDAAAVLKALGIQHAHIVGISMGGFVALQMALRHPAYIEKLVLVATSAGGRVHVPPSPEMTAMLGKLDPQMEIGERMRRTYARVAAPGYFESHPKDWDRVAENARYRPQSQAAYFRQLQASMTNDVSSQLDQIQAPTLVVHGELDPLAAPENGRYLAQNIKGAKLLLYSNTGHALIIERAEEFNRDVLAFLENQE
jgi:pimeloyl-ACP methyl ester carboxylesterase